MPSTECEHFGCHCPEALLTLRLPQVPGLTPDEIRPWRWLETVRRFNTERARRETGEQGFPEALPDAG
ncbi:hypothetical protein [Streptomyces sp. NPDC058625]|uniref:hypothetical protein n=1 Tax=Streptomyces sp. NPDC058625 TaxID=3346564 RepID=UPI003655D3DF